MFLKFFKRPLPLVLSSIILIGILFWARSFLGKIADPFIFENSQMPFYAFIQEITKKYLIVNRLLAFSVMLICSLFLIQLNSKHILIKYRTYLPALIFIILGSSFTQYQGLNPAVFAAFFLTIAIDQIFSSYDIQKPYNQFFMSSFFVSIASLFYLPTAAFLLLVFISIIIIRSFNFRDWVVSIAGFVTPWFFLFLYHYLVNDNLYAVPKLVETEWLADQNIPQIGIFTYVFLSFCGLTLLISLFYILRILPNQKINVRKFHNILIWFTIISGLIFAFVPSCSLEVIYIIAIPISFQFSIFFNFSHNRFWPEFFFVSLVLIAVLIQFF